MTITQPNRNVLDFFVQVGNEKELSKELSTIKEPGKIIAFAHRQGFDFTLEELKEGVTRIEAVESRQGSGELSDEQLDNVAGGFEGELYWWLDGAKEAAKDLVHTVGDALVSAGEALKRV
jgi:predicted ribosomally synthesized peptide with nif11-like leader